MITSFDTILAARSGNHVTVRTTAVPGGPAAQVLVTEDGGRAEDVAPEGVSLEEFHHAAVAGAISVLGDDFNGVVDSWAVTERESI